MAKRKVLVETFFCDWCHETFDKMVSESLAFGGKEWEIDLCPEHRVALAAAVAEWTKDARKVKGTPLAKPKRAGKPALTEAAEASAPVPPPPEADTTTRPKAPRANSDWDYLETLGFTRHVGRKTKAENDALAQRDGAAPDETAGVGDEPEPVEPITDRVGDAARHADSAAEGVADAGAGHDLECELCDKTFFNDRRLASHMKKEHGVDLAAENDVDDEVSNIVPIAPDTDSSTAATESQPAAGKVALCCDDCVGFSVKVDQLRDLAMHVQAVHRRPLSTDERTPRVPQAVAS